MYQFCLEDRLLEDEDGDRLLEDGDSDPLDSSASASFASQLEQFAWRLHNLRGIGMLAGGTHQLNVTTSSYECYDYD